MKKELIIIVVVILVAIAVVGAMTYTNIGKAILSRNEFGMNVEIVSTSPVVSAVGGFPAVSLNQSLSFHEIAENSSIINPANMTGAGWATWTITNTTISIYGNGANMSMVGNPHLLSFVEIQNVVANNITLQLTSNFTNGRVASYAVLNNNTTINAGFIVAVTHGNNVSLNNSATANGGVVVGRGTLVSGTVNVTLQPNQYIDLFLSTIPHSAYHPANKSRVAISV